MRSFFAIAAIAALIPAVFGAPSELKPVRKYAGAKKPNSYLVTLKEGASRTPLVQKLKKPATVYDKAFLNTFAAELDADDLNLVRAHPDVALIEEDGVMTTQSTVTQTNAPWGLGRISQNAKLSSTNDAALTYTYKYDSSGGAGVDVYIVDTGIYIAHSQFGGRAKWGATYGGYASQDGNGHGTHCAGTIGGSQFGVAKAVSLVAVKVLSDAGSGYVSDIINGLNYVLTQSRATGRPSIVSMSLGGGASQTLDDSVATLTTGGVHVVVAAGNNYDDVSYYSPARAPSAITVAASDVTDTFAYFSNYGTGVDLIAPGVNVISSYIGSTTATASLSGTSMATPHTAGLTAYYIGLHGNASPASIAASIVALTVSGSITSVPSGTVNKFLNNEF